MAGTFRFRRIILGFFVVVIVLMAGMVFWISTNLKRRQAMIDSRMAEAGISGEFLPLRTPALSAEGNFFNHPDLINLPLDGASSGTLGAKDLGPGVPSLGEGAALGRALDMEETVKTMAMHKLLPALPESGREAQVIRALFEADPAWAILTHQAQISQHAEFIPAMSVRPLPSMLLSMPQNHLNVVTKLIKPLILHGMACTRMADFPAGMNDLQALCFISSACRREGTFISEIVAITLEAQSIQLVWELLAQPTLPESELRRLRTMLDTRSYPRSLVEASLGEFAIGLQTLQVLEKTPANFKSEMEILHSVPGLLALNRCFYMETYLNHYLLPLSQRGPVAALAEAPAMAAQMKMQSVRLLSFEKIVALLLMPSTEIVLHMGIHEEAQRRQALTACALELFQRQHGKYPASLAELSEAAPLDPVTDKAFGYKPTSDGRYQVWGIGFDGKDDGGSVPLSAKGKAPKLTHADYRGDWTWRYTFTP
ncbi:MAG: hypothetical protein V4662_22770 [Verrucomicrobiota bacterium]